MRGSLKIGRIVLVLATAALFGALGAGPGSIPADNGAPGGAPSLLGTGPVPYVPPRCHESEARPPRRDGVTAAARAGTRSGVRARRDAGTARCVKVSGRIPEDGGTKRERS